VLIGGVLLSGVIVTDRRAKPAPGEKSLAEELDAEGETPKQSPGDSPNESDEETQRPD